MSYFECVNRNEFYPEYLNDLFECCNPDCQKSCWLPRPGNSGSYDKRKERQSGRGLWNAKFGIRGTKESIILLT